MGMLGLIGNLDPLVSVSHPVRCPLHRLLPPPRALLLYIFVTSVLVLGFCKMPSVWFLLPHSLHSIRGPRAHLLRPSNSFFLLHLLFRLGTILRCGPVGHSYNRCLGTPWGSSLSCLLLLCQFYRSPGSRFPCHLCLSLFRRPRRPFRLCPLLGHSSSPSLNGPFCRNSNTRFPCHLPFYLLLMHLRTSSADLRSIVRTAYSNRVLSPLILRPLCYRD